MAPKPCSGLINSYYLYLMCLLTCIIIIVHSSEVTITEICDANGTCHPKVFEATEEFKEVLEGQEIPRGTFFSSLYRYPYLLCYFHSYTHIYFDRSSY